MPGQGNHYNIATPQCLHIVYILFTYIHIHTYLDKIIPYNIATPQCLHIVLEALYLRLRQLLILDFKHLSMHACMYVDMYVYTSPLSLTPPAPHLGFQAPDYVCMRIGFHIGFHIGFQAPDYVCMKYMHKRV